MADEQAPQPISWCVQAAARSDPGKVRAHNEDAVYVEPAGSRRARARGVLCLVADGMGGHAAGEVASHLAVQTVHARYYGSASDYVTEALEAAITAANTEIARHVEQHPETAGMGCTLTAAVVCGGELVIGHVGDSRAYLVRDSTIRQLTADHSWVAEQVVAGVLTAEQAEQHPDRNVLLRALGHEPFVAADIYRRQLKLGDVLVICSDGLSGVVADCEIGETASQQEPGQAVDSLVSLANQRGAPDNVSVVVARIAADAVPTRVGPRGLGYVAAGVAAGLLGVALYVAVSGAGSEMPSAAAPLAPAPSGGAPIASEPPFATAVPAAYSAAGSENDARVVAGEAHLKEQPTDAALDRDLPLERGTQVQRVAPAATGANGHGWDYVEVLSGQYRGRRGYVDSSLLEPMGVAPNGAPAGP